MSRLAQCFLLVGQGLGASTRTQLQPGEFAAPPGLGPSSANPDGASVGTTIGVGGEGCGPQAAGLPCLAPGCPVISGLLHDHWHA